MGGGGLNGLHPSAGAVLALGLFLQSGGRLGRGITH